MLGRHGDIGFSVTRLLERSSDGRLRGAALDLLVEAARDGETTSLAVNGSCMEPLIRDGDRVIAKPWPTSQRSAPRIGDLVLARTVDDDIVCHRVLAIDGKRLALAGDRSSRVDRAPADRLLGQVEAIERQGRVLHLGRSLRWLDAAQARLHRWCLEHQGRSVVHWIDLARTLAVIARAGVWLTARRGVD